MAFNDETFAHLKPVFEACDKNGDGFVKTKDLLQLVQQHTDIGSEVIENMIGFLDPDNHGSISFDHFCSGVKDFMAAHDSHQEGLDNDVDNNNELLLNGDKHVVDDDIEDDRNSQSTTSTNDYNGDFDEDSLADDYAQTSNFKRKGVYSTYPPKGTKKKDNSSFRQRMVHKNNLDEDVSETSEYQSDNGYGYSEVIEDISIGPISSTPVARRRPGHHLRARNKFVSHSLNTSPHRSFENLEFAVSDNEANLSTLSDKIVQLTSEVSSLQLDHSLNQDKHVKIKNENKTLFERINALEELLEQQKLATEEKVEEESRRYNLALTRLGRDSEERLEKLQNKLNEADEEINSLKQGDPMLRRELEQCIQEKHKLQEKISDLEFSLSDKIREIETLEERLKKEKNDFQNERKRHTQEVLELQSNIEELKSFKNEAESKLPGFVNAAAEKGDLEDQLRILQKENQDLANSRDELRVQLIQQGKYLLEKNTSLADELLTADKEDVLKALRDQESLNYRLRCYTDSILMMIMEYNPELLEKS